MAEREFDLEIITPERTYYTGKVQKIVAETTSGQVTILAKHADFVTEIAISSLTIVSNNLVYAYATSGGNLRFIQEKNTCYLFLFSIERADEIDIQRAKMAKDRANELLANAKDNRETLRAEIKLKRALNRIKVKSQGK